MSKLVLMFHGKFHCIKAINVRKENIVQTGPLTGEIKKNHSIKKYHSIPSDSVIRDKKSISRGNIHKKKLL